MHRKLDKPYSPSSTEARIYDMWEKSGYFNPDNLPGGRSEAFTIIMPPPNANGSLHIGHAVFITLQDIIIRFERMRGKKALWLPGADHAGFETQIVYEKKLQKEGHSRLDIPREDLYSEMLAFTLENKKIMENQLRKLGASCDWSREKFTLDSDIREVVYGTFKQLADDDLVYRGKRIVSWCTKHQTAFSDLEITHVERKDPLYYMKYGPFTLATVRPETKFGDTAIAVNPKDARYKKYVGKEIEIDTLIGKAKLKVIADDAVDPEFGTGVVKVTPAHDPNDFEMAGRHNLEVREVIDKYGRLNKRAGIYAGLKVAEAREKIVADLQSAGLMEKIDHDYTHTVQTCYKCGCTLEPRIMSQWFVKMAPLAKRALKEAEDGNLKFVPNRYKKIYSHWLSNIHDWNISRQIVWGIPIPAKICEKCGHGMVDVEDTITSCEKCGGGVVQDTDTFDTWFSSGQWPFATLKTTGNEKDFETFYPTQVMETGADILFFWVARMVMLGLYRTGKLPFSTVYLHGLVRDKDRAKMSKSKGNVIDPLGVVREYGTDALRMALVVGNTPGNDAVISLDKVNGYKKFANKIWNIARFVLSNTEGFDISKSQNIEISDSDKKHLEGLDSLSSEITGDIEKLNLYLAAEKLYHYTWHTFADVFLEKVKRRLDSDEKISAQYTLLKTFETIMKLLHPFMPFLTEELWQMMGKNGKNDMLIVEAWPHSS